MRMIMSTSNHKKKNSPITVVSVVVALAAIVIPAAISYLGDGKLKAIIVSRRTRHFSIKDIPDMTHKTVLITGPTLNGIGHATALELAKAGAHVVLAGRNPAKGMETKQHIESELLLNNKKLLFKQQQQQRRQQKEEDPPSSSDGNGDGDGGEGGGSVEFLLCDLTDPTSVQKAAANFVKTHNRLDVLILNAGVMASPFRLVSPQLGGIEEQFAANHVGHFLLTRLLLPTLQETSSSSPQSPSRIVIVTSLAHYFPEWLERVSRVVPFLKRYECKFFEPQHVNAQSESTYNPWIAYGRSKLANVLFANELTRRLSFKEEKEEKQQQQQQQQKRDDENDDNNSGSGSGSGSSSGSSTFSTTVTASKRNVRVNSLHPGIVATNLQQHAKASLGRFLEEILVRFVDPLLWMTPQQGSMTSLYVATSPELDALDLRGKYFHPGGTLTVPSKGMVTLDNQRRLWELTERLLQQQQKKGGNITLPEL